MIRFFQTTIVVMILAATLPGCASWCGSCSGSGEESPAKPTQAVLAAARANQISLFGDVSDGGEQTYFTRRAVSLRQHTFTEVGRDLDAAMDSTGRFIVFASTRHNLESDLYIKTADGLAVTQLTSDPSSDLQPVFSPDGSRVAFASNRAGNWDIWVVDRNGGAPVQITSGQEDEIHPSWSPDGTQLVYCSLPATGGQWELWVSAASAVEGALKRFIGYGLFPEWSPTGDTIVFQRARERGSRWFSIWTIALVDGEPRYPTEIGSSAAYAMILPTWSPDGRRVAYTTVTVEPTETMDATSGQTVMDIWVMNLDGRSKVCLTDAHTSNFSPVFAADGRVFFTSDRSGHENIWSLFAPENTFGPLSDVSVTTGTNVPVSTLQPVSDRNGG